MTSMLIATTPSAMEAAHTEIVGWCAGRLDAVRAEIAGLEEELAAAKRSKWNTKPFQRRLAVAQKRIAFYEKIRTATDAGFYIVPNFMMDAFAVRTDAIRPKGELVKWGAHNLLRVPAKALPTGEGQYVAPQPEWDSVTVDETAKDGKVERVRKWYSTGFLEPDFPMVMAKPEIVSATERAMALKAFDEIGIAQDFNAASGDPMILGRIRNPRSGAAAATFFIAWALPLDRW